MARQRVSCVLIALLVVGGALLNQSAAPVFGQEGYAAGAPNGAPQIQQVPVITVMPVTELPCPVDRPRLLLREDFNDGAMQKWAVEPPGAWYIAGDDVQRDYYVSSNGEGALSFQSLPLESAYSILFNYNAYGGTFSVLFGMQGSDSSYGAHFSSPYPSEMSLELWKSLVPEGTVRLGAYGPDYHMGYQVRIDVDQGRIRIFVSDETGTAINSPPTDPDGSGVNDPLPVIDYTDPSPLAGDDLSFRLKSSGTYETFGASIDDVTVCTTDTLPDLTVQSAKASYDPASDVIVVEAQILNQGGGSSGETTVLARNGQNLNDAYQVVPLAPLQPNQSTGALFRIKPNFEQYGKGLFYQVVADPDDLIVESNPDNNILEADTTVLPPPADLLTMVEQVLYDQTTRVVTVAGYIKNSGGIPAAPSQTWIYSQNAAFASASFEHGWLAPGEASPFQFSLPAGETLDGQWVSFSVVADEAEAVREWDERNNLFLTEPILITRDEPTPVPLPDLIIRPETIAFNPDTHEAQVEALVRNAGSAPAVAGTARLQGPGDILVDVTYPGLSSQETYLVLFNIPIPAYLDGQAIELAASVDIQNTSPEASEDNNTAPPLAFLVPEAPISPTLTDAPPEPTEPGFIPETSPPIVPQRTSPIPGILFSAAVLGGVYLLFHALRPRPARGGASGGGQDGNSDPLPPLIPPIQLLQLWVTEGVGGERIVGSTMALTAGSTYTLHARLAQAYPGTRTSATASTPVEVVFFALPNELEIGSAMARLNVPNLGDSRVIMRTFRPRRAGVCRIRACVYYQNILVQSALLEAEVTSSPQRTAARFGVRNMLDYVASANPDSLIGLPGRVLNILINDSGNDTHWVGFHIGGEPDGMPLMITEDKLRFCAKSLRTALYEVERLTEFWSDNHFPVDPATHTILGSEVAVDEDNLMELAEAGVLAFDALFESGELDPAYHERLHEALSRPGIVSIARLKPNIPTMPWSALYRFELITARRQDWRICPNFHNQILANRWQDANHLLTRADTLDRPSACVGEAGCVLNKAAAPNVSHYDDLRKRTVCPFGFLGFTHQIEQPAMSVVPVPADGRTIPAELSSPGFSQSAVIPSEANHPLRVTVALYQGFSDAQKHFEEIRSLCPGAAVQEVTDLGQMLYLLEQGDQHILYLYCHGTSEGERTRGQYSPNQGYFGLQIGPENAHSIIRSADIPRPGSVRWKVPGLVFLNGCSTVAGDSPVALNDYVAKLRRLGASGIIGSEIDVDTRLGRPFGRLVIQGLMCGQSLGEAFLAARLELLRQGCPLGLAYTHYAPADLHVHLDKNCQRCQRQGGKR